MTTLSTAPPTAGPERNGGGPNRTHNPVVSNLARTASRVVLIPSRSAATTGRGFQMLVSVLRHTVTDAFSFRFPAGEAADTTLRADWPDAVRYKWVTVRIFAVSSLLCEMTLDGGTTSCDGRGAYADDRPTW